MSSIKAAPAQRNVSQPRRAPKPTQHLVPPGHVVVAISRKHDGHEGIKEFRAAFGLNSFDHADDGRHMVLRLPDGVEFPAGQTRLFPTPFVGLTLMTEGYELRSAIDVDGAPTIGSGIRSMFWTLFNNAQVAEREAAVRSVADEVDDWDIEDDGVAREGIDEESQSKLEALNGTYCTVLDGNMRVMYLDENEEVPGRRFWKSIELKAFKDHFSNIRIQRDTTGLSKMAATTATLGDAWVAWPGRPSAVGLTFDPTTKPGNGIEARIVNGRLNLWSGFGVTPLSRAERRKFKWDAFGKMILDDLCDGNEELFAYVMRWLAYKIQNPALPAETSLVFKGAKGVGKTTLGEAMVKIFGSHGLPVSRRNQFAGQFSGHLATACFVFADEAVWGGNKDDEGTLKKLITDRHMLYRAMYKEEAFGVNRVGLLMATNEEWAVPATFEERRFVVSEVSDRNQVSKTGIDAEEKERRVDYWATVHNELRDGGLAAFMTDMLAMDLGTWTPRQDVPKTAALAGQVEQGLKGVQLWYYEMVTERRLPCTPDVATPDWRGEAEIESSVVLRDCREWLSRKGARMVVTHHGLFAELKKFGWSIGHRSRVARRWAAPSYKGAVGAMEARLGRKAL
jgi:hypothetical protein